MAGVVLNSVILLMATWATHPVFAKDCYIITNDLLSPHRNFRSWKVTTYIALKQKKKRAETADHTDPMSISE
jgi:hypothetical protein